MEMKKRTTFIYIYIIIYMKIKATDIDNISPKIVNSRIKIDTLTIFTFEHKIFIFYEDFSFRVFIVYNEQNH